MTDVVAVVATAASSRGIGHNGKLPWRIPGDMAHFQKLTSTPPSPGDGKNAVIMGRKTWESIPVKFRPLSGRLNIILSRSLSETKDLGLENSDGVMICKSLEEAKKQLSDESELGHVFVIGGESVYKESLESGYVNRVVCTEVDNLGEDVEFDRFFPNLDEKEWECRPYVEDEDKENEFVGNGKEAAEVHLDGRSGLTYKFLDFRRRSNEQPPRDVSAEAVNEEEMQYLNLCRDIINNGVKRGDRTGTGTLSKFGTQMRFSLRDGTMPLLTTKRTFWRGVVEELLWFISGSTNANDLTAKDIHIWDGNASREFLDSRGLHHREVGDLGPVYGFQWRFFGAEYVDMHTDYKGKGFDQLADCIHKIRNNPEDRRIVMSAWNPSDLGQMALPPCHMFCQFYVDTTKNELSCQMYQRSADMGLGVPFNIASYALLTHMVAHVTDLKPGDFVHTIGDAHVYLNHVHALEDQFKRTPRPFPKIRINSDHKDIDAFVKDDFQLLGYKPHKPIKMKMAV